MLGKLLKYDLRSTWREFAAVYLAIVLSVFIIPFLFKNVSNTLVSGIAGFLGVAVVIATIVVMIIMLFRIYNTNVFSKEGYLTMTLPVSSSQIVVSKLLISSLWIILTGIVATIGFFIFVLNMRTASLAEISVAMREIITFVGSNGIFAIILMVIAMILSTVKEIAKLFLACSIAHIKQLKRFRIPAGILSYFAFSWIEVLIVQFLGWFTVRFIPVKEELIFKLQQLEHVVDPSVLLQYIDVFNGLILVSIVYALILIVAYALGSIWILNHKLDLD